MIADVELVVSELASKTARNTWFQVVDVSALVHEVRRPDAHCPLEHSAAQCCYTIPDILELFTITSISNGGEASIKVVHVMAAQQFANPGHVDPLP